MIIIIKLIPIQVSSDQTISKPFETFEQFGYRFDNVMGYDAVYFGVEDLLSGLYDVGAENINQDFSESYSEGKYIILLVILLHQLVMIITRLMLNLQLVLKMNLIGQM